MLECGNVNVSANIDGGFDEVHEKGFFRRIPPTLAPNANPQPISANR